MCQVVHKMRYQQRKVNSQVVIPQQAVALEAIRMQQHIAFLENGETEYDME